MVSNAATVKWVKGDNPFGRTAVVMLAAIAATLFGFLNIGLAFTALMAFIGALLLLLLSASSSPACGSFLVGPASGD